MSKSARKKKKIGNSASMTAVVIEAVVETSEDPHHHLEEVIEVVVLENSDLDHQVIAVVINAEPMILAHLEIAMVVEAAHPAMVEAETTTGVVTDK